MALNQGKLLENLEKLVAMGKTSDFIYDFLEMYGTPKATTTRLKSGTDTRNVGLNGDVGLKKKLYFRASTQPIKPEDLDSLCQSDVIARNDIRFVFLTDFERVLANDLTAQEILDIPFSELAKNYHFFLPVTGKYEKAVVHSEHPADLKASEKMGQLFDLIRERNKLESKEDIHALNVFLTRLLFCFYAEDTDIFKQSLMTDTIKSVTKDDGSDLDQFFATLFSVLNLPEKDKARSSLPAYFNSFPYVNGGLFEKDEPIPEFGAKARRLLIECGGLNWSEINPDIFGSMFQAVIDPEQRGNLGQHYTSVSNIMKVIQPLFLDKLYEELDRSRASKIKLEALLVRLQGIRVFDPACGSGNFLIIAYKELRKFEMEVFKALNTISGQNVFFMSGIQLSQFYGIEIDDFAHEVAILSLWLAEHQMNKVFAMSFGHAEPLLPLKESGNIVYANSLRKSWDEICPISDEKGVHYEIYVCGNPPFHGNKGRTDQHIEDMDFVLGHIKAYGRLDFVACWLYLAAKYAKNGQCDFAFVTTNSLCQGEQVGVFWPELLNLGIKISFAYQTFEWKNQAKGNAGVHVSIVGMSKNVERATLFTVENKSTTFTHCKNISPYLLSGPNNIVFPRRSALSKSLSPMENGSEYSNSEPLILSSEERTKLKGLPEEKWIKRLVGSKEFINGIERFCFWLEEITESEIKQSKIISARVQKTEEIRRAKSNAGVLESANRPHLFKIPNHPKSGNYILVPRVSSVRRKYIPIGFLDTSVVATNKVQIIPNGTLYDFGIITSIIHMDWMRVVGGRLKSDYSYSASLVYNTFPWPEVTQEQKKSVEALAEAILLVREDYPDKTLADLYDPDTMPRPLKDAHEALDVAVDALYRKKPFKDSTERLEHLFALYQDLITKEAQEKAAKRR